VRMVHEAIMEICKRIGGVTRAARQVRLR
jgi:hypothetical protein